VVRGISPEIIGLGRYGAKLNRLLRVLVAGTPTYFRKTARTGAPSTPVSFIGRQTNSY
jgi:hypothetical protein